MQQRAATLIIPTWQRADALRRVLASVALQRTPPHEVIVADDGSTTDTTQVVAAFAASVTYKVHHVRQEHAGFRVARLRNLGIARASGELIVLVDGDMCLHPEFLTDHLAIARRGRWTQGVRIPLDDGATSRALDDPARRLPGFLSPGIGVARRLYTLRAPRAASMLRHAANTFIAIKACNMAIRRDDLLAVNGFNEEFVGWGLEDKELAARLAHRGIRRQTLLFGGIAWHLRHPPASRHRADANRLIFERTIADRLVRCERGLDSHL